MNLYLYICVAPTISLKEQCHNFILLYHLQKSGGGSLKLAVRGMCDVLFHILYNILKYITYYKYYGNKQHIIYIIIVTDEW